VSGLPELVQRTGATAYMPAGADVTFKHDPLDDGDIVELGNDRVQAVATPGHTPAHHAYLVTDTTRSDDPWLVFTGDALLVGDAGRPDLHAHGNGGSAQDMARELHRSITERLLALPEHLLVFPAHYAGSVCGRGLSGTPVSTIGFERRHNPALARDSQEEFVGALTAQPPPVPDDVEKIVEANRTGRRASGSD
jgi:hydroxyacylglutathione hydrolase